jgi:hypothetical protein
MGTALDEVAQADEEADGREDEIKPFPDQVSQDEGKGQADSEGQVKGQGKSPKKGSNNRILTAKTPRRQEQHNLKFEEVFNNNLIKTAFRNYCLFILFASKNRVSFVSSRLRGGFFFC